MGLLTTTDLFRTHPFRTDLTPEQPTPITNPDNTFQVLSVEREPKQANGIRIPNMNAVSLIDMRLRCSAGYGSMNPGSGNQSLESTSDRESLQHPTAADALRPRVSRRTPNPAHRLLRLFRDKDQRVLRLWRMVNLEAIREPVPRAATACDWVSPCCAQGTAPLGPPTAPKPAWTGTWTMYGGKSAHALRHMYQRDLHVSSLLYRHTPTTSESARSSLQSLACCQIGNPPSCQVFKISDAMDCTPHLM